MKIGIYSGSFNATDGGGYTIEKEIVEALRQQASQQNQHSFVLFSFFENAQKLTSQNFEIVNVKVSFFEKIIPKIKKLAFKFVGKKTKVLMPAQKIIVQSGVEAIFYLSPWENFEVDIPYFSMVWDLQHRLQPYFPEVSAGGEWEKREAYYRKNLPKAAYIITGNDAGKTEIARFYNIAPERIKLIPHPTPSFAFTTEKISLKIFNPKNPFLLYPAQFWAHKNHLGALKTIKILKEEKKMLFDLVFVGSDKGNKAYIVQQAQVLGVSEQVHFLGFVAVKELLALYQNAFCLLYLTYFGPENLPPLEAFALRCPVVASRVEGAEAQMQNAALLVSNDPQDAASAVFKLWNDHNLRKTLIEKGSQVAQQRAGKYFARAFFEIVNEFEPIRNCW